MPCAVWFYLARQHIPGIELQWKMLHKINRYCTINPPPSQGIKWQVESGGFCWGSLSRGSEKVIPWVQKPRGKILWLNYARVEAGGSPWSLSTLKSINLEEILFPSCENMEFLTEIGKSRPGENGWRLQQQRLWSAYLLLRWPCLTPNAWSQSGWLQWYVSTQA